MKKSSSDERHDENQHWEAVLRRDRAADGRFVYGVRSTGIYCRPTCPSRRPRRENVVFFSDARAAERGGFRACFRCRPRDTQSRAAEIVSRARTYLESVDDASLADVARAVGVSPYHLQRTFTREVGVSPRDFLRARRGEAFKRLLRQGTPVADASYDAGYGSSSRAYEAAGAMLAMTPAQYRRAAAGIRIRFTTARCSLGRVLVAATERGVCAIRFGDDDAALEAELRHEFARAEIARVDHGSDPVITAAIAIATGSAPGIDLPLDVRATVFQRRVWNALRAIPRGDVRTYAEVAAAIGAPRATRAVARACAANPVAVVVPCHRVIRGDGALAGYRWGEERKRRLLRRERVVSTGTAASAKRARPAR